MVGVVDAGTVEMVGRARMRGGRPCFLILSLPCSELDPRPTICDLYNVYKSINVHNTHNMHIT